LRQKEKKGKEESGKKVTNGLACFRFKKKIEKTNDLKKNRLKRVGGGNTQNSLTHINKKNKGSS